MRTTSVGASISNSTDNSSRDISQAGSPQSNSTGSRTQQGWFASRSWRSQLALVAVLALGMAALGQWLTADQTQQANFLERYGSMVANQLARLSQDAMVREDAIALMMLAEQVAEEPAITAVTVYSIDGTVLATYGEPAAGPNFTRPIQLADATAGFVKVTVDATALNAPTVAQLSPTLLRSLAGWLLSALALWAAIAWLTRIPQLKAATELEARETRETLLLVVRLFNSTDMHAARREALMDACDIRARSVAQLYQARFERLSNNAIALLFDEPGTQDRSFQAACAALVIARLCNQPGGGRYRYSLQQATVPASDAPLQASVTHNNELHGTLEDALLHAALAEDNNIVLSASYALGLTQPQRLELTREHSPALAGLQKSQAQDYYLLSKANAATEEMLERQIAAIRAGKA